MSVNVFRVCASHFHLTCVLKNAFADADAESAGAEERRRAYERACQNLEDLNRKKMFLEEMWEERRAKFREMKPFDKVKAVWGEKKRGSSS